jgi:hypothetical protein
MAEESTPQTHQQANRFGLKRRAEQTREAHAAITLARFEVLSAEGTDAGQRPPRRVRVQRGERTVLLSPTTAQPRELSPGVYTVANLFVPGRDSTSAEQHQLAICCTVSELPVTATFVLPDHLSLEELEETPDEREALKSLSVRTSNGILGAVRVQISLRVQSPRRLIHSLGTDHLDRHLPETEQKVLDQRPHLEPGRGIVGATVHAGMALLSRLLLRKGPPEPLEPELWTRARSLTIADVYPRIRHELLSVIRATVHQETAASLYDTVEVRERVQQDIQRYLAETLDDFGLAVDRVSAFQFFSPDYEELLENRGKLAIAAEELVDVRTHVAVQDEYREINKGKAIKDAAAEGEVKRHLDEHKDADEDRRRGREGKQRAFDRDQREADEGQEVRSMLARGQAALQLAGQLQQMNLEAQEKQRDAEHRRKLEVLRLMAGRPPEEQLVLALSYDSQLQHAFVAAQQARSEQEKLAMAQRFQDQLVAVYGQQSGQVNTLLLEAARQLGAVAVKRVEAGGTTRPLPEPPPSGDAP